MKDIELLNGDCLELMKNIPDKSVDMVLCDLPYEVLNKGNKHAQWDKIIPFDKLWEQYERLIKDNGAIVLFGQGMFSAKLMMSNETLWRYNLIWDKGSTTGFLNANKMPLRQHEDIIVFYKKLPTYNPQMSKCFPHERNHGKGKMIGNPVNSCYGKFKDLPTTISDEKFPASIIFFKREHKNGHYYHPTQKPVALLEYLIKTYSNEGETVLDNTMGSGSTMVACVNTNRKGIGIEMNENYFNIAKKRVKEAIFDKKNRLF